VLRPVSGSIFLVGFCWTAYTNRRLEGDLIFDTSAGNPGSTIGTTRGIAPGDVSFVTGPASPLLTLNFTPGKFVSGCSVSFTIDQDNALTHVSGGYRRFILTRLQR
jgi:hypothetical protein